MTEGLDHPYDDAVMQTHPPDTEGALNPAFDLHYEAVARADFEGWKSGIKTGAILAGVVCLALGYVAIDALKVLTDPKLGSAKSERLSILPFSGLQVFSMEGMESPFNRLPPAMAQG